MSGGPAEVEIALRLLEQSETFARAGGLLRLLRFLIEHTDPNGEGAKETYVGAVFYGREGTYDPRYDSIVRVSVKRLRERLIHYYATEGKHDSEQIVIPLGTYNAILVSVGVQALSHVEPELHDPVEIGSTVEDTTSRPASGLYRRRLWSALALAGVCCAALAIGLWWHTRSPAEPSFVTQSLAPWPLTPGRDVETDATVSPDGKTLAYVTRKPGREQFQIFLRPFLAIDQIGSPLETGSGNALRPAWSPDGKQLAFLHCSIEPCDVEIVPIAGGTPRRLCILPQVVLRDDQPYYWTRQQRPIWTPDGKSLIFPTRGQNDDRESLVLHDIATGNERILTTGKKTDTEGAVALSPDGRTVAFIRVNLNSSNVMTLDLSTHQQQVIAEHWDVHTDGMTWSPDGKGIVVSMQHDARWQPWWVPLHGQPKRLAVNVPEALNPVFARDGHTLMVTSVNRSQNIVLVNQDTPGVAPRMLFRTTQRDIGAKFSPDGERIAFLSNRSGRDELWIAEVGEAGAANLTSQPVQLTHNLPESSTLAFSWSPDGRSFLVGFHGNLGTIGTVDARSGNWSLLKVKGLEDSLLYCPIWSADGHWIFASAEGERNGIFRIAPDGRVAPEHLVNGRTYDLHVDGDRYLYFDSRTDNGISRISLQGLSSGSMPKVQPIPELATVLASRKWVIEAGGLYYLDFHDEDRRLRRFDLRTSAVTAVTGRLPDIAFATPTLSVLSRRHIFLYAQWDPNTGSQIVALRPD